MNAGELLATAMFMALVANRLIEALVVPLFEKFQWDKFFLQYISWAVGSGLVALSSVNLFTAYVPNAYVGLVLTAIVCGGGSNIIADLFGGKKAVDKDSEKGK